MQYDIVKAVEEVIELKRDAVTGERMLYQP